MQSYNHAKIERKWQEMWEKEQLHKTPETREGQENYYLLTEFPYPSGDLHVGHWYAFAMPDIVARTFRRQGKNVLFPIGFDAFGLPAENAAIKHGVDPRQWTYDNMEHMRKQLRSMGASFDWSREVVTCEPDYYHWTQWLFLQMYKQGLAYQAERDVNWCSSCKTVLANEQVVNGRCERCDTEVEKRRMLQWSLKITNYADRLLSDLEPLAWPEEIKESQRNWIGKSEGAELDFALDDGAAVSVFTTRPDTLYGATYLVLAPEHSLVADLVKRADNADELAVYIAKAGRRSEMERTAEGEEKSGIRIEGVHAINPATKESIPVWVADYVLAHYGTGAVMGVPAHDERDFAFAQKYGLPIKHVVMPTVVDTVNAPRDDKETVVRRNVHAIVYDPKRDAYLALRSQKHGWDTVIIGGIEEGEDVIDAARREVHEEAGYTDITFGCALGGPVQASYFAKHKDENRTSITQALYFTLASDERVEPVEDDVGEVIWVKPADFIQGKMINSELPHWLERIPKQGVCAYTGSGVLIDSDAFSGMDSEAAKRAITKSVGGHMRTTYRLRDWVVSRQRYWGVPIPIIHCAACGIVPVPDEELPVTLPAVSDYLPAGDGKSPLAKAASWVQVTCPTCGAGASRETDTFDTFVDSSWYFLRYTDSDNTLQFAAPEKQVHWMPVNLYSGGAEHTTMHLLYSRFWHKALFDLGLVAHAEPYTRRLNRGLILGPDGHKMSKSKGNVIDPDEVVEKLGADTVRLYLAFIGPYAEVGHYPWNENSIAGVRRFLDRTWRLHEKLQEQKDEEVERLLQQSIKKVGDDITELKFNTAIAQLMTLLNAAEKQGMTKKQYEILVQLLAPFAPHIAEELWEVLGGAFSVHTQPWPAYDPALLIEDTVTIPVQVNGKVRAQLSISPGMAQDEVIAKAKELDELARWLTGDIVKEIYVPDRLVNFVSKT